MATYHMTMKIGYSENTTAHLKYIRREGKYSDREDMLYTETCNLPAWADNSVEFWNAVKDHDQRACRKLEFAIPNELSREEQMELAQRFLAEILPNHAYTYAIHEKDSALHGEKNPHVHVMFSERIIDERTKDLSRYEFFKKYGKAPNGKVFGGSKKDRAWAGRGRTGKLYQVRAELERRINEFYSEKNIEKNVSSKSLAAQKSKLLYMGAYSESEQFNRIKPMRLADKKFMENRELIQTALRNADVLGSISDPEIRKRVLQEKSKMIKAEIAAAIVEIDAQLEPTETEKFVALEELESLNKQSLAMLPALSDSAVIDAYKNSILALQLQKKEIKKELSADNGKPVRVASVIKAVQLYNTDIQFNKDVDVVKEIAISQVALDKTRMELLALNAASQKSIFEKIVNTKTNGQLKEITNKIRSKESLVSYNEKLGSDISALKKEVAELKAERAALVKTFSTPEIKAEVLQKDASNQEKRESLAQLVEIYKINIDKLTAVRPLSDDDFKNIQDYKNELCIANDPKRQKTKTADKKTFESSFKKERIDLINTTIDKRSKEYRDLVFKIAKRSQNINYYYDKLLNEKTNGEYKKLTEIVRSKKDLLAYNEKLGSDISALKKDLAEAVRQLERLKMLYGGQKLLSQAAELQQADRLLLPKLKQQYIRLEKNVQRDYSRRYISTATKSGLNKVKKLAEKLLGKDDPHVGAAHIRTDTRENMIGQGMQL